MVYQIIESLGGPSAIARALGVRDYTTVASWGRRGSIPARYWQGLIVFAGAKGIALSADDLVKAHAVGASGDQDANATHEAVVHASHPVAT